MLSLRLSTQLPRRAPQSLSLGSLGVTPHVSCERKPSKDIPRPMTSAKLHGFQIPSSESLARPATYLSAVPSLSRRRHFRSSPGESRRQVRPEQFAAAIASRSSPVASRAAVPYLSTERAILAVLHSMRRVDFRVSSIPVRESIASSGVSAILMQRPQRKLVTPNHALQRTAPCVTVAAISCPGASRPSHLFL